MIFTFSTLFFVLVAALLVERFFDCSKMRNWGWVQRYHDIIDKRFAGKNSMVVVLIMLLPVALLISLLELNLRLWFYGVLGILFEFAVLLYSFGPRSAWQDVETIKGITVDAESRSLLDVEAGSFRSGVWMMFERRIISPAFWFILLGAGGVFFYRMTEVTARVLSQKSETAVFASRAKVLLDGLDWVPVRIVSIIFALAGHFSLVFAEWKKKAWSAPSENESLLVACGDVGLGMTENGAPLDNATFVKDASNLVERSVIIFMVILALLVLVLWR